MLKSNGLLRILQFIHVRKIKLIRYLISIFAASYVSALLIVFYAWFALTGTEGGSVETVGHVLALRSVINLAFGPFLGVIIDRIGPRLAGSIGCLLISIGSIIILNNVSGIKTTEFVLIISALFTSSGVAIFSPSLDAILQTTAVNASKGAGVRNFGRQGGMIVGSGLTGILLASGYGELTIYTVILVMIGQLLYMVTASKSPPAGVKNKTFFLKELGAGIKMLWDPVGAQLVILFSASLALGQLTNSLLAGLIVEKSFSAVSYGLSDASWSVGAIVIAGLLSFYVPKSPMFIARIVLLVASLAFVLMPIWPNPLLLCCAHFILGGLYSGVRTIVDGMLLDYVPVGYMGRVKSNVSAVSGFVGVLVYLSPSILGFPLASTYYVFDGILLIAICLFTILKYRNHLALAPTSKA